MADTSGLQETIAINGRPRRAVPIEACGESFCGGEVGFEALSNSLSGFARLRVLRELRVPGIGFAVVGASGVGRSPRPARLMAPVISPYQPNHVGEKERFHSPSQGLGLYSFV